MSITTPGVKLHIYALKGSIPFNTQRECEGALKFGLTTGAIPMPG